MKGGPGFQKKNPLKNIFSTKKTMFPIETGSPIRKIGPLIEETGFPQLDNRVSVEDKNDNSANTVFWNALELVSAVKKSIWKINLTDRNTWTPSFFNPLNTVN